MAQPVIKGYIDRVDDTGVTTFNLPLFAPFLVPLSTTSRAYKCVAYNESNGDMYAGVSNGYIYKRTGEGDFVSLGVTGYWLSIDIDPTTGYIYANNNNTVYRSIDGTTFTSWSSPTGYALGGVAAYNGVVYCGTAGNGTVWKRVGEGTWTNCGLPSGAYDAVAIDKSNGYVYAGGDIAGGVYRSTDGTNFSSFLAISPTVYGLSVNSSNGDIYAATTNGVFKSINNGAFQSLSYYYQQSSLYVDTKVDSTTGDLYVINNGVSYVLKGSVSSLPAAGDLLLAIIAKDDDPQMVSNSGMTRDAYIMGSDYATFAFSKIVTASDITTGYMTFTGDSEDYLGRMYVIQEGTFDPVTPLVIGTGATGTTAAPYAPSITVQTDALVFAATGMDDNDIPYAITTSGWTSEFNNSVTDAGLVIAKRTAVTSGATGQVDFTTAASDGWAALQIAVNPGVFGFTQIAGTSALIVAGGFVPYKPTLVSPADTGEVSDTTPSFQFYTSQKLSNSLEYNLQVGKSSSFDTFSLMHTGVLASPQDIAVNSSNGDIYYACSGTNGGLYKQSGGNGEFNKIFTNTWCHAVSVNSSNGDVYTCVNGGLIYKQTGGQGSFDSVGAPSNYWFALSVNSSNGDVYASVSTEQKLYKQTGGSGSFVSSPAPTSSVSDIDVNPSTGDVYIISYTIYKQTAGSGTFNALGNSAIQWTGISVNPSNGDVYATLYTGDIYKQTAGSGDFVALGQTARSWRGISVNPSNGDVYALCQDSSYVNIYVLESPVIDANSSTDSGFENITTPADTHPFNSGDTIQYTVQAGNALTSGSTYYWRVRAIDP